MKKTTFTFYSKFARPWLLAIVFLLNWNFLTAQNCSLGCSSNIQISLDNNNCIAVVTPADLLTDSTSCPAGSFYVELSHNGYLLPSDTITHEYVGETLEAKVIDENSTNSCWGWISVEDKLAPIIDCTPPKPMNCLESEHFEPLVIENCGGYTLYILDSIIETNLCDGTFQDSVLYNVTKVYKAVDLSGNESQICTISYDVVKLEDLSVITPPPSRLFPANAISCIDNFPTLSNGNPSPEYTGYPKLDTFDLIPNSHLPCNLLVNFNDDILKDNGCIKKILRTWTIMEWSCDPPSPRIISQMIEIADTIDPVISGTMDILATTTPHHCDAIVEVPGITVDEQCGSFTVTISGGTPTIFGNGGTTSLPVGIHTLTYTVSDDCGNTSTAQINVTVEDLTPPVPVCDQNTTISVSTDGQAWVHANVFDDGSYDECQLDKMLVRRMDIGECDCEGPNFDDFVSLGEYNGHYYILSKHKIEARLANKHGIAIGGYLNIADDTGERQWINNAVMNYNDTLGYLTNVGLDKNSSNNYFVDIKDSGSLNSVGNTNDKYHYVIELEEKCGWSSYAKFCCEDVDSIVMVAFRVVDKACNYNDCMVNAYIQDKLPPSITCPPPFVKNCSEFYETGDLNVDFGAPTIHDNCSNPDINDRITFSDVTQCNVGDMIRTITVTDAGGRTSECAQSITINSIKVEDYDIIFPDDFTLDECIDPNDPFFDDPSNTGEPIVNGDTKCTLVGIDYADKVFTFNNTNGDACFKIIRTWTFIDWCNKDENNSFVIFEEDQVIKIEDSEKPEIQTVCSDTIVQEIFDVDCEAGQVTLTSKATDNCTEALTHYWRIDVGNNGVFDAGFYKDTPLEGEGIGNDIDASGIYPVGRHRIRYIFADRCGNITSCDQIFEVVNMKAPTPYCYNGLAVELMATGMVELWAEDFDAGSFHSCAGTLPEYEDIILSFSPDVTETNMIFTCDDLGDTDVQLYASVIVHGDTLQSFCNTYVNVQDNMGACEDDGNRVVVLGNLLTEDDRNVSGAMVELQGTESALTTTNDEGFYTFGEMPQGGTYTIVPTKDDDPMNGVSTLDLVMIQRHILNIEEFDSPYKNIAADVNKDGKITASDLVELRKLILGVIDAYPDNQSWRFIDATFTFDSNDNPLAANFNESYDIDLLTSDMIVNFKSVKVGDVNQSVKLNARGDISENRSSQKLELMTEAYHFKAGSTIQIKLSADNAAVSGVQFTIEFDESNLNFVGVNNMIDGVNESNFGFTYLNQGIITFSWNEAEQVNLHDLFTLEFVANKSGNTSNLLNITSAITAAEAYDQYNEVMDVILRNTNNDNSLVLYQNIPNPFSDQTTIAFNMPYEGNAIFSVIDIAGKTLYTENNVYKEGMNRITLSKSQFNNSGILYYQLTVGSETVVKKMVVIE
jgi:hypothetical protein